MTTTPSCLLVLLLLIHARHAAAASTHASYYKLVGSSPKQATTNSLCKIGKNINQLLPVVQQHRQTTTSSSDVQRHDASRIRRRSISSQSSSVVAAAAPAPSPAATTIPANTSLDSRRPPGEIYSVVISYGTPEQQFPVLLDTSGIGVSLVRCNKPPCASGSDGDCERLAFDTSKSSTFVHVLCGSPDCPTTTNCSHGSVCLFENFYIVGTYAEDVITLAPSKAVHDFRFVCLEDVDDNHLPVEAGGILDLSRDRSSLPSRLGTTFSYCLPHYPSFSEGFLYLGGFSEDDDYSLPAHAPLLSSADPELSNLYLIDLVRISLAGKDLPIPAGTFGGAGNTSTAMLDVGTTFTMLAPDVYAPLRNAFRKEMSHYNRSVPGFAGFDTCFNFTGVFELTVPILRFKFSNGEDLAIQDQMLYYDDTDVGPFGMSCLAFSSFHAGGDVVVSAVIGTYTLGSTEVVYDVARGKVGFNPWCC